MYQKIDTFFNFYVTFRAFCGRFAVFLRKVGQQFAEGVLFPRTPSAVILPLA
jgi:hypothetical protein